MKKFTASLVITALVIFLVGFPEVSATESVAKSYFSYNGTNYEFIIVNSGTESSVKIAKSTSETGQIAKLENAMKTEIEEVNQLKSELLNQKSVSSEDLSVIDLILAKNEYLSNPVNFIKKDGKCMSEDDFLNIMKYNEGNQEFIVRYIDKPEVTTAVTTTTPKATTTVATTTPNAITTTVVTTYPQTTTTSNVSTTQESAEIQLIKKIVKEISIKDTIAVGDNSDGNVFLFHAEGGNYAYSLEGTAESLVVKPSKVTAVHIWKYEGSEQPFNLTLPEAPAQFIFRDKSYEYELKEYSKINYSEIIAVQKSMVYILDEEGEAIPEARFKILDENGDTVVLSEGVTEITTLNRKIVIKGLPTGNYTLTNVYVPEGYLKPADVQIEVLEDAIRVLRVEVQTNVPRGGINLSTTYVNIDGETKYAPRSKYKIVNPTTGEVLRFTKTLTGDYIKSELEDAVTEINLKSGVVEVTGIEVGTYEIGLTGVTDGYGMKKDVPETIIIQQDSIQNVNVEVVKQKIKQISAGDYNTVYLDENGEMWVIGRNTSAVYGNTDIIPNMQNGMNIIPYKIKFPDGVRIEKFVQGKNHTVAIDTNGKVWTWSSDSKQALGDGINRNLDGAIPFCISNQEENPLKNAYDNGVKIVDIKANLNSTIAIDSEGRLWAWGDVLRIYEKTAYPICISQDENTALGKAYKSGIKIEQIFSWKETTSIYQCLDSAGRLWEISTYAEDEKCLTEQYEQLQGMDIVSSSIAYIVDNRGDLWKVHESDNETINPIKIDNSMFENAKVTKVVCNGFSGYDQIIVLDENGKVWEYDDEDKTAVCISNKIDTQIVSIDISYYEHVIALGADGGMYGCFGSSYYGELGVVNVDGSSDLFKINIDYTESLEYNLKFKQIEGNFAIDENGKIWTFGGYSGIGTDTNIPMQKIQIFADEDFIEIDDDSLSSIFAITKTGKIYLWGTSCQIPEKIEKSYDYHRRAVDITEAFELEDNVKIISASSTGYGNSNTVIDSLGRVWAWGSDRNLHGYLGLGDVTYAPNPVCISDDSDESLYNVKIVKTENSYYSTFAIDDEGKMWIWGNMDYSGISKTERLGCLGINQKQTTPLCVSEIVGTQFHEAYKQGIKFIDISAYKETNQPSIALDSNGEVWILQGHGADEDTGCKKLSQMKDNIISDNYSNIPNYKIVSIKVSDRSTILKDNIGDAYRIQGGSSDLSATKIGLKNMIDSSYVGYISPDGQIYNWENKAIYNEPVYNELYNKKVKQCLGNGYVEVDSNKGEIYTTNGTSSEFVMYSERYLQDYLGIELAKSDKDLRCSKYNEISFHIAIDTNGKVWTWGSNYNEILGRGDSESKSSFYEIPQCISDIQGLELNEAYKNDSNFKIIDMQLYSNVIVLLDNKGKIWACGYYSPTNENVEISKKEFICISDIEGTELNQKYIEDENFKITSIETTDSTYGRMFKDSNDDIWQWNSIVGNNTPVCVTKDMTSKVDKIIYYYDSYHNIDMIYMIDKEGKVWAYGTSGSYPIQGWNGSIKRTPYKISDTMSGIKDLYVSSELVIAYGNNSTWVWGYTKEWGDYTPEQFDRKQYTPIEISNDFTIDKVIDTGYSIIIIDIEGKVWSMGYNNRLGYTTENGYEPLTCISDEEDELLYGVKMVDGIEVNRSNFEKYVQNVSDSDILLISDSGDMYNIPYDNDIDPIYKLAGKYNKYNSDYIEYLGELRGKTVIYKNDYIAIDSEGNLYSIVVNSYPICITTRQYSQEPKISSNNILLNDPIENKLKDIKFQEIINDQIVKDENENYWYFPSSGETVNLTQKINDDKNPLYGKTIIDVVNNNYVITSDNEIYHVLPGQKPVYVMKTAQGIEIKQIYMDGTYYIVLDNNGKIWTCGSGKYGQLGNGKVDDIAVPVCISDIEGTDFNNSYKQDSNFKIENIIIGNNSGAYSNSIVALDNNGKIWSWGCNVCGELGNGTTMYSKVPICISNIEGTEFYNEYINDSNFKIQSIIMNYGNSSYDTYGSVVAIDNNGRAWTWGYNHLGQLGDGNTDNIKTPTCISKIEGSTLSQLGNDFKIVQAEFVAKYSDRKLYLLGNNGKVYKSNTTGIECADENMSNITNLHIYDIKDGKIIAYGENNVWEITSTPVQISTEFTPKEVIGIGYKNIIILDTLGKVWTLGPVSKYLGFTATEEQTTAICISENETLPIYQKNITDIAKLRIGNSSYNIIAIDSDGKAYEWGASLDMIESNKIDVATQTIYGDTTSVHKMEVVNKLETAIDSYYADRVLKCRVFINGKFYEINNANFDEVNEVIVTQENWVSPISEFLDGETFKTVDGTVYKIMSLELVKYYTPIQEKEYNTTIRIPGANIVSQTRYKALDDQGNLYVVGEYTGGYSSTVEPICATQGDYVVEPIYSSGNGWTQVKKVY